MILTIISIIIVIMTNCSLDTFWPSYSEKKRWPTRWSLCWDVSYHIICRKTKVVLVKVVS